MDPSTPPPQPPHPPQPAIFSHTLEMMQGVPVLHLAGVLELEGGVALRLALEGLMEGGARHVIIEMSALRYVASTGIAVLIQAHKRLRQTGGDLFLAKPSESVKEVLQVINLATIIPVYRSVEAALLGVATP